MHRPSLRIAASLLLAAPTLVAAATYRWPDVAPPCNTATLQACLNAVAANDLVQVQTSATLNEGPVLVITKPLTLTALSGYRPVLAAGTSISATYAASAGSNWSLTLEGFTLLDGAVNVQVGGGNASVVLRGFDITNLTQSSIGAGGGANSGLGVRNNGSGSLSYEIDRNRVRLAISSFSQPHAVSADAPGGGTLDGRIHDNRFSSTGPQAASFVTVYPQGASTTRVYANQIDGATNIGLTVFPGNLNVAHRLVAVGNAIACRGSGYGLIPVAPGGGSLDVQVFNNTLVGCQTGLGFSNSGTVTGRIANNLIAYNNVGLALGGFEPAVGNDHNLLFANTSNFFTPGAGTLSADPLLRRGKDDARLGAGSPAIDAADSTALRNLLAGEGIGEIDADGLRRFKGATGLADIGAFEYGDTSLSLRRVGGAANLLLNSPALNGAAGARPLLTATRTAESYQAGNSNGYYAGFSYAAPNYYVSNELAGVQFPQNVAFNVFVPAAGGGALLHTSSVDTITGGVSFISDGYLDNQGTRIVLAAHRLGSPFNAPFATAYFISKWGLWMGNVGNPFPVGLDFHVYGQDPSLNAFRWVAADAGGTSYTQLNQATINGEPCAQILAQRGQAQANPHPIQLRYVSAAGRWRIENVDGATLPAGADFFVLVDEAATVACRYDHLFHDEFDPRD